jgi:hypothetical protein
MFLKNQALLFKPYISQGVGKLFTFLRLKLKLTIQFLQLLPSMAPIIFNKFSINQTAIHCGLGFRIDSFGVLMLLFARHRLHP